MLVGLSLSYCVADILDGKVNVSDVLVIVTRTDFNPTNEYEWNAIMEGYTTHKPIWRGYKEDAIKEVVMQLYEMGKLHQPRQFGSYPPRVEHNWLETFVPGNEHTNPAVKKAWDNYKILAGLS